MIENRLEFLSIKYEIKVVIPQVYNVFSNNNDYNHQYLLHVSNESDIMPQLYKHIYPMRWKLLSLF